MACLIFMQEPKFATRVKICQCSSTGNDNQNIIKRRPGSQVSTANQINICDKSAH